MRSVVDVVRTFRDFDPFVRAMLYGSTALVVASGLLAGLAMAAHWTAAALPALPATVLAVILFVAWVTLGVAGFGLVVVALAGVMVRLLGWKAGLLVFAGIVAAAYRMTVHRLGPPL